MLFFAFVQDSISFSLRTSVVECSCVTLQHVPNMRTHFILMVDVLRDDGLKIDLKLFSEKSPVSLIRETLVLVGWLCFYNEHIDINVRFATASCPSCCWRELINTFWPIRIQSTENSRALLCEISSWIYFHRGLLMVESKLLNQNCCRLCWEQNRLINYSAA